MSWLKLLTRGREAWVPRGLGAADLGGCRGSMGFLACPEAGFGLATLHMYSSPKKEPECFHECF